MNLFALWNLLMMDIIRGFMTLVIGSSNNVTWTLN